MKPNFFIVGAPKCGTTAMARYLSQHDRVFFSTPKEPAYFVRHLWLDRALPGLPSFRTDLEAYLALFKAADPEQHLAIGEGSTLHLCSRQALEEIHSFQPDAKIIVMLRNPVDLAYSFHSEILYHMHEDEPDFETAWRLQEDRKNGKRIPRGAKRLRTLLYGDMATLGRQMQDLLDVFSRAQVHWIFFDDFNADTGNEYRKVLTFLGLPDDGRDSFQKVNQNTVVEMTPLLRLLKQNMLLRNISGWFKQLTGRRSWGIVKQLQKKQGKVAPRPEMSASLRQELQAYFDADIRLLESLTGRDLSLWRNTPDTGQDR